MDGFFESQPKILCTEVQESITAKSWQDVEGNLYWLTSNQGIVVHVTTLSLALDFCNSQFNICILVECRFSLGEW